MEALFAFLGLVCGVGVFYAGFRVGWVARDRIRGDEPSIGLTEKPLPEPFELDMFGKFIPEE